MEKNARSDHDLIHALGKLEKKLGSGLDIDGLWWSDLADAGRAIHPDYSNATTQLLYLIFTYVWLIVVHVNMCMKLCIEYVYVYVWYEGVYTYNIHNYI